jgi:hypothetical protein
LDVDRGTIGMSSRAKQARASPAGLSEGRIEVLGFGMGGLGVEKEREQPITSHPSYACQLSHHLRYSNLTKVITQIRQSAMVRD